jgi:hypothetical protein
MKFLVTFEIFETLTQEDIKELRAGFGPGIQQITQAPQTVDMGFFADARGGYLILEIEDSIDFYKLLGPEIFDNARVTVHPLAAPDVVGQVFAEWGQQGR